MFHLAVSEYTIFVRLKESRKD